MGCSVTAFELVCCSKQPPAGIKRKPFPAETSCDKDIPVFVIWSDCGKIVSAWAKTHTEFLKINQGFPPPVSLPVELGLIVKRNTPAKMGGLKTTMTSG